MTAQVHEVLAFDIDSKNRLPVGLVDLKVTDASYFGVDVSINIGEPAARETDGFRLICCSPSWFAAYASNEPGWRALADPDNPPEPSAVVLGTGLWFMRHWDAPLLRAELDRVCSDASGGPTWGLVASRISRWVPWEFDHRYDADIDAGRTR